MAEGKKSVLLYCDLIHTVSKLDDETAGKLFKHYLSYVNDEKPEPESLMIEVVFEPIKQQLKRDLVKWEEIKGKRSDAGKKSAEVRAFNKRQQVLTSVESVEQTSTNPTVSVKGSVTVNDSVTVNEKKKEKKGVVFPFDSILFRKSWIMWKDYKKNEHKFSYKTVVTEQAALMKLNKLAAGQENNAVEIINESIANGWKGFFKTETNNTAGNDMTEQEFHDSFE